MPSEFLARDNMVVAPAENGSEVEVVRGPNIKPFPLNTKMPEIVSGKTLIKVEDNITTDHIMPSNAKLLPYRSNIPHLAEFCLTPCDPEFPKRAKENNGGFIIGGVNYGQGSSREHAALAPLYLGIKGVLAKSFARIHMANLINSGILPLVFKNEADYDDIAMGDELCIENAPAQIAAGEEITVKNLTKGTEYVTILTASDRQKEMLYAGGLINFIKLQNQ